MDIGAIEIASMAGFGFVVVVLGRMTYGRRMDVLYGPYIEGRKKHSPQS